MLFCFIVRYLLNIVLFYLKYDDDMSMFKECNLQTDQYVESIPVYWAVLSGVVYVIRRYTPYTH